MKRKISISIACLALLFVSTLSYAQNDSTTVVEEEIEVIEDEVEIIDDNTVPEPPPAPNQEEIDREVEEAIREAEEAVEEAVEEAMEAVEEALEGIENESDEDNGDDEVQIIIDGEKVKIVIHENHGDSVEKEHHKVIIGKESLDHSHKKGNKLVTTDWFNFQLGWANVLNAEDKLEMPIGYEDMEMKSNSLDFQMTVVTQAWNLIGDNVRFVYGLGFDWNRYNFANDIRLMKDQDGLLTPIVSDDIDYDKNRLVATYLTMPVMLNLQLGHGKKRLKVSGGLNMGYLLNSYQRLAWEKDGEFTGKIRNDFNLQKFRMGYEAQVGYGAFHLYGKYFPSGMFKEDKGPDVSPFSVGIMIGTI